MVSDKTPPPIEGQRKLVDAPFDGCLPGLAHFCRVFQRSHAFVDQVKTHMRGPVLNPFFPGTGFGQLDGLLRHLRLQELAVAGNGLDRMAIAIASEKIHFPVNPGGVQAQRLIDLAHGLDKLTPVQSAQETQTVDGVTDGDLVGGLVLALELDQLLDGKSLVREPLLEPGPRQVHRRALAGQPLRELRHKSAGQRQGGLCHLGDHHHEVRGILLRHVLQALDPQVSQVAIVPGDHQAGGDPAQVFDQGQPEHNRNGP